MKQLSIGIVFLLAFPFVQAQKTSGIHSLGRFSIASAGGWDYLAVEPESNRLFVSHGNQVNVLDKNTGDSLGVIEHTFGVHGIAFSPADGFGYTSNGKMNNISVFQLSNLHVTAQIPVSANPDAILYEPFIRKIITCNGRAQNLNFIDPAFNRISDSIALGGKPETAVSNGKGLLYVNVEDKNEIAVVDLTLKTVKARYSLLPDEGPTGLVLNKATNRLYAATDKNLVVLNAADGKIVSRIPISEGCDGVGFDPVYNYIYTSNGSGTLSIIRTDGPDHYTLLENLPTEKGARTIAVDPVTHKIYLPTADFGQPEPGSKRPPMIPGSFRVLVYGK